MSEFEGRERSSTTASGAGAGSAVNRNRSLSDVPPAGASVVSSKGTGDRSSVRTKVAFGADDPLNRLSRGGPDKVKKENLSIRVEDEPRIVSAMINAAKKQTTGSIYSVEIDISRTRTLGMGVKDLAENILCVSLLKRKDNRPGAGEEAGVRLGDIIFGVNFVATRNGSRTLITIIKEETERGNMRISLQGWRCHQLCSDPIPGTQFPRADEFVVQAYSLFRTKVFSDWERWNFIEIMLGYLSEDMELKREEERVESSTGSPSTPPSSSPASSSAEAEKQESGNATDSVRLKSNIRVNQMRAIDLEKNILQAKGLRTALCVRIVHTKQQSEAVVYVLRVEDVESGLQWVVQRRYRDFHALNEELTDMTQFTKEIEFPKKRISIRKTAKLVEDRIVNLEQYVRKLLHLLTLYATMDSAASKALRSLQNFLGVDSYIDALHPPIVDDQRFMELMAYRFLNDFSSPACQQCVRFVNGVELDTMAEEGPDGYLPVLQYMRDALAEVEQFVQQQHQQQMMQALASRRPNFSTEQLYSFVNKCIRRQVEAALYLPLRRTIIRIVYSYLAVKSQTMQRAMALLQQAPPAYFQVDVFIQQVESLPRAVKAFRRVIEAYLPADQGHLLVKAANAVLELHKECVQEKNRQKKLAVSGGSMFGEDRGNSTGGARPASIVVDTSDCGGGLELAVTDTAAEGNLRNAPGAATAAAAGAVGEPSSPQPQRTNSFNGVRSAASSRQSVSLMMYEMKSGASLPDLMSKAALADPVGLMFQATDTQPPPSLIKSTAAHLTPTGTPTGTGVISNSFRGDDTPKGSNRVTFNMTAPSAATRSLMSSAVKQDASHNPEMESISKAIVSSHLSSLLDEHDPAPHSSEGSGQVSPLSSWQSGSAAAAAAAAGSSSDISGATSIGAGGTVTPPGRGGMTSSVDSNHSHITSKLMASHRERFSLAVGGDSDDEESIMSHSRNISTAAPTAEDAAAERQKLQEQLKEAAISADDFLPLFTYALVQAGFPQLMLVKELMVMLIDDEDSYGECGKCRATRNSFDFCCSLRIVPFHSMEKPNEYHYAYICLFYQCER